MFTLEYLHCTVMKKVVLFKSASEDYHKIFSDNNYEVVFIEPLQFNFTNLEILSQKLLLSDYTGLILTSPRAIEALAKCWSPARYLIWSTKRVYTVGDASCLKIKQHLGLEASGMKSGSAEYLANIIVDETQEKSKYFFPCGNLRSESLPNILESKGINVDSLTVYETKEHEELRTNLMQLNNCKKEPICMVFFSPSGCEYIHRQLQTFSNNLSQLPHFAIGNSTAHKIENLGVDVAGVAAKPKADSVIESVQKYFATGLS